MCPATRGVSTRLTKRAIRLTRVSCKHITTGYRENCLSPYTSTLLPHCPVYTAAVSLHFICPTWLLSFAATSAMLSLLAWCWTKAALVAPPAIPTMDCNNNKDDCLSHQILGKCFLHLFKNSLSVGKDPFMCMCMRTYHMINLGDAPLRYLPHTQWQGRTWGRLVPTTPGMCPSHSLCQLQACGTMYDRVWYKTNLPFTEQQTFQLIQSFTTSVAK